MLYHVVTNFISRADRIQNRPSSLHIIVINYQKWLSGTKYICSGLQRESISSMKSSFALHWIPSSLCQLQKQMIIRIIVI